MAATHAQCSCICLPRPALLCLALCPPCQVLKLSKEKWEEARDHAMRAVVADNRMRIWWVAARGGSAAAGGGVQRRALLGPQGIAWNWACGGDCLTVAFRRPALAGLFSWQLRPLCPAACCACLLLILPAAPARPRGARYADKANMEVGLLFTCRLGDVDLDRPVGECTGAHGWRWAAVLVWRLG